MSEPTMSPDTRATVAAMNEMAQELAYRAPTVTTRLDYYAGKHPLRFASPEFRDYFAHRFAGFRDNWCAPVVEAPTERMNVLGVRVDDESREVDKDLSRVWRASNGDRGSSEAFVVGLAAGFAYATVWGDPEDADEQTPLITWERPDQAIVRFDADTHRPRQALRLWRDETREYSTFDDGRSLWKFSRPSFIDGRLRSGLVIPASAVGGWEPRQGPSDDTWPIRNPMGRPATVELRNRTLLDDNPMSDIGGVIAMQDAINLVWAYLMNALDFASLPQRIVLGADIPTVPVLDENGQVVGSRPIELDTLIKERILWIPGDQAKTEEWTAANLDAYSKVIERAIEHIAAQTRTPPHYLIGKVANLPLALDTVVPVPGGRTTMGELSVGDEVFAVDGSVQTVVGVSPVFYGHDCYRMTFDDGTQIVADAVHKWQTTHFVNPANPYGPAGRETSVVTTREIAESLRTSMGTNNHYIPVAQPHDGPEVDFPIDPYVLGVFLGDGDRIHGLITSHVDDAGEMADHLRDAGELVDVRPYSAGDAVHENCRLLCIRHDRARCPYGHERPTGDKRNSARCVECARLRYRVVRYGEPMPPRCNSSFVRRLKDVGVWKNKHIPESYFHGSFKQRLALLQGLMDTDGTVKAGQGSVTIGLHDERLAGDLHRLIQSLGHKAALRRSEWSSRSLGISGQVWRMTWSAPDPVFRLARKVALQRTRFGGGDGKSSLPFRRYVVSCEPVESVPVRCINVSSSAHLFCVTDAFVATHNSAEALTAAETGLVAKTGERLTYFGQGIRDVFALIALAQGDTAKAAAVRAGKVVWKDTQFRALGQKVDALQKLFAMGFPFEWIAEQYGLEPDEVARVVELRRQDQQFDPLAEIGRQMGAGRPVETPEPVPAVV